MFVHVKEVYKMCNFCAVETFVEIWATALQNFTAADRVNAEIAQIVVTGLWQRTSL